MYSCQRIIFKKNIESKNFDSLINCKTNTLGNDDFTYSSKLIKYSRESNLLDSLDIFDNDPLMKLLCINLKKKEKKLLECNTEKLIEDDSKDPLIDLSFDNEFIKEGTLKSNNMENEIYYFCKLYDKIDYYILRIIYNDTDKNFTSKNMLNNIEIMNSINEYRLNDIDKAKKIIIEITRKLNHYYTGSFDINNNKFYFNFGDEITFHTFNEYIFHLKKIFKSIIDSYSNYKKDKKDIFTNLLVFILENVMELSKIDVIKDRKSYNGFTKNILTDSFISNTNKLMIDYITITGNKNIRSFEMSKSCITNIQFQNFVDKGGYFKEIYWSKEGMMWRYYNKLRCPKNWRNINGVWYINNEKLELFNDLPVEQISYYEAEACSNFYSGRLPTEKEWLFVASNRNLTLNPYGLYNPCKLDLSSDCDNIMNFDFGASSLLGFNQLYGNVWEYTSDIRNSDEGIEVCLKGGDSNTPEFIMNNNLKLFLSKDTTGLQTGFRIIKSKLY